MRDLKRNTQQIFYSIYLGKQEKIDTNGNRTGVYIPTYDSTIQSCYISVSSAQGYSDIREFGEFSDYDKTMSTTQTLPIDELTRLWIDETDTTKPHDYIVMKVAKGLDQHKYAIKKVKVSGG